jgi:hypothetical protein
MSEHFCFSCIKVMMMSGEMVADLREEAEWAGKAAGRALGKELKCRTTSHAPSLPACPLCKFPFPQGSSGRNSRPGGLPAKLLQVSGKTSLSEDREWKIGDET